MKKYFWVILIIILAGSLTAFFFLNHGKAKKVFQFAQVARGDLTATISSTGSLGYLNAAVVNFGTSGTVAEINADFNQKVRKGQQLAALDKTLPVLAEKSAEVSLSNAIIQRETAKQNYSDTQSLFNGKFKSQSDLDTAKSSLDTAEINVQSCRIELDKARANLKYAVVSAPFNGVVIDRNVDIGQSVNSGASATNYLVASDTTHMQILATVDESDISSIKVGQKVQFSVQSYQDKTFEGTVTQIRLQPAVVQNVVNYTIVVDAVNQKNMLLPGMTATLSIVTESHANVLKVPNAALKFRPPAEMIQAIFANRRGASGQGGFGQGAAGQGGGAFGGNRQQTPGRGVLWTYDEKSGKLGMIRVKVGMNDGQVTEVSALTNNNGQVDSLEEGMKVLSGISTSSASAQNRPQQSILNAVGGGGRGPGGPGR